MPQQSFLKCVESIGAGQKQSAHGQKSNLLQKGQAYMVWGLSYPRSDPAPAGPPGEGQHKLH